MKSSFRVNASSSASLSSARITTNGNSNLFRISITNLRCKYLPAADLNGFSDPYVVFDFDKQKQIKTPIKKKTLNPVWADYRIDYLFELKEDLNKQQDSLASGMKGNITIAKQVLENKKLYIDVWDYDLLTKSDYLGSTELDFYSLATGPRHCIFTLMNKKKQKKAGTIEFSIECELLSDISVSLNQVELSNVKQQQQQGDLTLCTHALISNESSSKGKKEEESGDEMPTAHLAQTKCEVKVVPNEKIAQDMTLSFCRTSLSDLRRQGLRVELKRSNMTIATGDVPFKEFTKNYFLLFNPEYHFAVEIPLIHINNGSVAAKLAAKLSFDKLPYITPFVDGARTDSSMCGIPMFIQLPLPNGYNIPESLIEDNEQLLKEATEALAAQKGTTTTEQVVAATATEATTTTSSPSIENIVPAEESKTQHEEAKEAAPAQPEEPAAQEEEAIPAPPPSSVLPEEPAPAEVEPTPVSVSEPAKPAQVPNDFKCNMTQEIMKEPVLYFGYYVEKKALEDYLKNNSSTWYVHPVTKNNVDKQIFENHYKPLRVDTEKKAAIETWLRENPQVGVEQFLQDCDGADLKTFEKSFFLRGYNPLAKDEHDKHSYCYVINSFSKDSAAKLKALLVYSMNPTACEWLTSHFYSLNHSSNKEHQIRMNALINCAYNGNLDMLKILIQHLGKYLSATAGSIATSATAGAAGAHHYQLFKILDQKSTNGYSLLHYAAYRRDVALIDYLMQLKQDILSKLQQAAAAVEAEQVKQVQEQLFNLCEQDKSGEVTPLFIISSEIQDLEYMKKLFKTLPVQTLRFHTSKNFNLLHYCLLNESESIVKFFLNHLHQLSILETLLNQKTTDSLGYTPFHRLILQLNQKNIDIVLKSIHFDSFINIQSNFNETVLHLLIKNSNFDGKHQDEAESDNEDDNEEEDDDDDDDDDKQGGGGGDVEEKQQQVEAYFLKERQESILAIVEQLLAYGIDLALRNNDNKTALDLARDDGYDLIVEAIERNERARKQLPSKLPLLFKEIQELKQENSKLKEQLEEYQKLKQTTSSLMFELKKLTQTVKMLESKLNH